MEVAEQKKLKVPKLRFREFFDNWSETKFTELINKANQGVNTTVEKVSYSERGKVVIRSNNISENVIDLSDVRYVDDETYFRISDNCKPKRGDILYCNIGSALGSASLFNSDDEVTLNWNVFRIQHRPETVDNNFLTQNLNRERRKMRKFATESTMPFISSKAFGRIKFNIPSLPEQQKIAGFLSAVDEKLQHLNRKKELLQQYKKGVMQKLFSQELRFKRADGTDYPDWEEGTIGDYSKFFNGYIFKSNTYCDEGAYRIITISNVQNGRMTLEQSNRVMDMPKDIRPFQKLNVGDILISMTGNVGRVCKVVEENCLLNQRVGKLVPQDIDVEFFYQTLLQEKFLSDMVAVAQGGAQDNLSMKDIMSFQITVPSINEQQKIADFLSSLDEKIDAVSAQIELTQQFKKGLLQEMFV